MGRHTFCCSSVGAQEQNTHPNNSSNNQALHHAKLNLALHFITPHPRSTMQHLWGIHSPGELATWALNATNATEHISIHYGPDRPDGT